MKTNTNIFILLTFFYVVVAGAYAYWSWLVSPADHKHIEVIGSAAIAMLAIMSSFIAFYLGKTARNFTGPEDKLDANIEDGEAEMGFFAPWSWWPFMLGIAGAICFSSLAIGWWMFIIGLPLAIIGLIGFVFEHSRGLHAH